jgi:hypothetical protein
MRISELIQRLEVIEMAMGDVVVECSDGSELTTEDLYEDHENDVLVIA